MKDMLKISRCFMMSMQLIEETLFLDLLAHHHSRVVNYQKIEDAIWAYDGMTQDKSLTLRVPLF